MGLFNRWCQVMVYLTVILATIIGACLMIVWGIVTHPLLVVLGVIAGIALLIAWMVENSLSRENMLHAPRTR